jgi:hypothetical protein
VEAEADAAETDAAADAAVAAADDATFAASTAGKEADEGAGDPARSVFLRFRFFFSEADKSGVDILEAGLIV